MLLHKYMFVAALFVICDGFLVKGSSGPLVVALGSSVVLPCYVDEPLPLKGLKIIWIRTDINTLVHVYQDYESRPDAQYQDYHGRAHFFTDQIKHGNFSLCLENVRAEDKGFYRCKVYTEQQSDETLVQIKAVEYLSVSGSADPVSAFVGEDVTLNCSVHSHITPEHIERVSWRKMNKDENILVFERNKTLPVDERYRGRVEFFTNEMRKGNFSLSLKSVRTEDKGVYICHVIAGNFSSSATAVLQQLGYSFLHKIVLTLCIFASGFALLFLFLWYKIRRTLFLQILVVSVPNLVMFFAYLFWGVIEGFLSETVACCAHYLLRPLLLLWASPHSEHFPGDRKTAMHCIVHLQYSLFANVVYSVLFKSFWEKSLNYEQSDRALITILFAIMILICITNIVFLLAELIRNKDGRMRAVLDLVSDIGHDVLPPLQLIFLCYAFGAASRALFVVGVFPLFLTLTRYNWHAACVEKLKISGLRLARRGAWLMVMIVMNAIMVYLYLIALEKEKDCDGWVCVAAFLQVLWGIVVLKHSFGDLVLRFRPAVYLIGSVVVVLVNSFAMMTELIMKINNGERAMEDLRKVVFSSECVFASFVLLLIIFEPWIKDVHHQNPASRSQQNHSSQIEGVSEETPHNPSNQNAAESFELRPMLATREQEARNIETQPDSVQQSVQ
ncbi:uncharacterized protein LOC120492797 isoform X1 [Pimephales promelas]|uniref:uncharacterized protein LOC120492797 isoform X1 n=1 Tax=Pimephales promelas TaxID=90988 RepID=UPI001955A45D|nr:uncharacterized protein LOC120492797 isoform X1 [Pimephales promelas]KAG1924940.1 butyrophilin-like protein [Pimephales promelas]